MIVLILLAIFVLLIINEFWWKHTNKISETNRKFVHITVGSLVAFWPFLISWQDIRYLSLAFIIVIIVSKYFNIFEAIHSVERPTIGEVFFAVAVGLTTYITNNKWIYLIAILQMSLADGLAAILGVKFGLKNRYKVFGQYKSLIGSLSFLTCAFLLLILYSSVVSGISIILLFNLALFLTAIENIGVFGIDNLLIPILTVVFLRLIG